MPLFPNVMVFVSLCPLTSMVIVAEPEALAAFSSARAADASANAAMARGTWSFAMSFMVVRWVFVWVKICVPEKIGALNWSVS